MLALMLSCSTGPDTGEPSFRARKEAAQADETTWELVDLSTVDEPKDDWDLRGPDSQWVYAGRWVTHPPVEMAVQLVGEEPVQACIDSFATTEAWSCSIGVNDCFTLMLFASGNVQLGIWPEECPVPGEVRVSPAGFDGAQDSVWVETGR